MANFIITATDQTGRPTTFTVDATDIRDATIKGSQNPLVRMGLVAITSVNPATIPVNQQRINIPLPPYMQAGGEMPGAGEGFIPPATIPPMMNVPLAPYMQPGGQMPGAREGFIQPETPDAESDPMRVEPDPGAGGLDDPFLDQVAPAEVIIPEDDVVDEVDPEEDVIIPEDDVSPGGPGDPFLNQTEGRVVDVKPSYNIGTLAEFFGDIGIPVRDEDIDAISVLPGFPVELLQKENLYMDVKRIVYPDLYGKEGTDQEGLIIGIDYDNPIEHMERVPNPAVQAAVEIYATRLKALTDFQGTANELITAQINATGGLGGVAGGLTPTQLEQLERDTRLIQVTGGLVQREGELFEPLAQQRRQEELIRATGGLIGGGIQGIEDLTPTQVAEFRLAEARGGLSPEQRIAELQQQQQVQRYEAETQRQNLLAQLEAQRQQVASQRQLALFGQLGDIYGDPARLAAMTQFQPNLPAQIRNMALQPSLPTVQPINIPIDPVMGANGQQEAVTTETTGVGEPGTVTGAGFGPLIGERNDIPLGYDRYTGKETGADIAGMTDEQRQFLIGSGAALGKSPSAIEQEIMANTPLGLQVDQSRLRSAPIRR